MKTTFTKRNKKFFVELEFKYFYRNEARENSPISLTKELSEATQKFKNMKLFLIHTEYDAVTIKLWHKRFIEVIYFTTFKTSYSFSI